MLAFTCFTRLINSVRLVTLVVFSLKFETTLRFGGQPLDGMQQKVYRLYLFGLCRALVAPFCWPGIYSKIL